MRAWTGRNALRHPDLLGRGLLCLWLLLLLLLLLLLQLLLLQLLSALLHLRATLFHLLVLFRHSWGPKAIAHRWNSGYRLLGLFVLAFVFVVVLRPVGGSRSRGAVAKHDLPRSAFALVAGHQNVISGSIQKLRDDVSGRPRSVGTEDTLIADLTVQLGACFSGYFLQNLSEA